MGLKIHLAGVMGGLLI